MFSDKVEKNKTGALLYGITPPKKETETDKMRIIAEKRTKRINSLSLDALVVYDIQDEVSRTAEARPFAYLPTHDPLEYTDGWHSGVACEKIIYSVPGKYEADEFRERLDTISLNRHLSVFVGAASKNQTQKTGLAEAYDLWNGRPNESLLGGVVIPERHSAKNDEHNRIIEKQKNGCSFFISQCVCNIELVKNFISDYCYLIEENGFRKGYFVFTLSVCGSAETLRLMSWLGIHIPKWMQNDLLHSKDILEQSIAHNIRIAEELAGYCREKDLCCGFNIESVSPKLPEVEAGVRLVQELRSRRLVG